MSGRAQADRFSESLTGQEAEPSPSSGGVVGGTWPGTPPGPRPSDMVVEAAGRLIRGTALIFWDPRQAGKKLDAIDTDRVLLLTNTSGPTPS